MDMNGISTHAGARKDGALAYVAQHIRILLVDRDTTCLMTLASQFEQQLYQVTTTESAKVALALFQERKNYYDMVIADMCMQEMGISEFVGKLRNQRITVPIILTAEEFLTMDLARQAMGNNVCYVLSKTPSHHDISNVWMHIRRVTGEMPALSDMTNYIEIEKDYGSRVGGAGNRKQNNLNMKLDSTDRESVKRKKKQIPENPNSSKDSTDRESVKRKKKQIADDPNSSNHAQQEDGHNAKKPRLSWTPYLDDKFLQALYVLGERGARPKKILSLMNESGLTARHVASHLQKYRRQRRKSLNLQKIDGPVMPMPAVLPAATLNSVIQGQTFSTASSAYALAPNLVHYSFYGAKQDQDSFNSSGNNSVNAIINDGVQVPKGSDEGSYSVNSIINDGVQEPKGNGGGSNSLQAPTQEAEGADGRLSNGLKARNQEPTDKFGPVLHGLGNAGNTGNMKNDDLGEGTSGSNQQFGEMPSNYDMNQFMQDLETSKVNIWDWFD